MKDIEKSREEMLRKEINDIYLSNKNWIYQHCQVVTLKTQQCINGRWNKNE
jgi:hypothetical protein